LKYGGDKKMQSLIQTDKEQVTIQVGQDLVHLVSHQLLNSAASLQIIYDLWSRPEALPASHQAETLQVLQHEVNFLHRLGRYILQFDRTNSGEMLLHLKPVDMVDLIRQMLPSFKLQGPARDFESQFEADLPLIWGDVERLQDVLNNLVSNALKYSAPFSPINISIQRDNGQVRVSVTNSGSSIPVGDEERIFTRFYRGQGHPQAGYGLGLYLARLLVGQHGGRIWVESPSADVTTFYFTLFLASQEQPEPALLWNADPVTLSG
jgi:two-component system phosphate regulon sensor histidine kinase PhoR